MPYHPNAFARRISALGYFFSLFALLYPLTNFYTAMRPASSIANVATEFDLAIPFIPSFIVIYNLSGGMLAIGFFLANNLISLYRLTHRLVLATLLGCLCFYALPLRFSFPLPSDLASYHSLGINWHLAYQWLHTLDKPYNQLPSLHVAYAVIMPVSVWQPPPKLKRYKIFYRLVVLIVCTGIAISTLLTWQHHLLDVLAGIGLAILVIWAEQWLFVKYGIIRASLIVKYWVVAITGFLLMQMLPMLMLGENLTPGWQILIAILASYWLLSFGLLATLYAQQNRLTQTVFAKKSNGTLAMLAWLLQLPIILIYRLMWRLATGLTITNSVNPIAIIPLQSNQTALSLLAISNPTEADIVCLNQICQNYSQIVWLDLACEMNANFAKLSVSDTPDFAYYSLPLLDLQPFDDVTYPYILASIAPIIEQTANAANTLIICQCAMGWSRSVAMVGCLLADVTSLTPSEIRQLLAKAYPNNHVHRIYLTDDFLARLASVNHAKILTKFDFYAG